MRATVLIDSDVFLIELRYPRDRRYAKNKAFLDRVRSGELVGWTTVYNLLEICGILSFNLSPQSLQTLFIGFAQQFNVTVLFPNGSSEEICFSPVDIFDIMQRKFSFGDALIADLAQRHRRRFDCFVTWNVSHFRDKLALRVATPDQV